LIDFYDNYPETNLKIRHMPYFFVTMSAIFLPHNFKQPNTMKTFFKFFMLVNFVLIVSCSNDDTSGNNADPIVGKWRQISETDNGIPQAMDACDLMEVDELLASGDMIGQDYELVGGTCVLQPNGGLPAAATSKWAKVSEGNYKFIIIVPGMPTPVELNFTAVFSNNNNTMTTTYIEDAGTPDQNIQVSVSERVN
jgi:hypothetical protein